MALGEKLTIRPSVIAGTWYPGSAPALRRTVEDYLAQASRVELPGELLVLVSPHAGYAYSGPTAEPGNSFTTSEPSRWARKTSVGVSAPIITGSPVATIARPSASSVMGLTR